MKHLNNDLPDMKENQVCFVEVAASADKDGKVQKEVEDYMRKSIDSGHAMEMIYSMEG